MNEEDDNKEKCIKLTKEYLSKSKLFIIIIRYENKNNFR
jgi:hypothetical protein